MPEVKVSDGSRRCVLVHSAARDTSAATPAVSLEPLPKSGALGADRRSGRGSGQQAARPAVGRAPGTLPGGQAGCSALADGRGRRTGQVGCSGASPRPGARSRSGSLQPQPVCGGGGRREAPDSQGAALRLRQTPQGAPITRKLLLSSPRGVSPRSKRHVGQAGGRPGAWKGAPRIPGYRTAPLTSQGGQRAL